jgi:calcineurin-like phosphoesterase family protein
MKTYFTSDLHFLHKNIVSFTERSKYTTQEDHTEWLIDLWNSVVNKADKVYHLGDFCFGNYEQMKDIVKRLNGQIFMLKGNHDKFEHLQRLKDENLIQACYEYKEIKIRGNSTVLFHFPVTSWHKQGYGSWHLHGHCHSNLKKEHQKGKILDVGLDNMIQSYGQASFFDEDMIEAVMQEKQKYIADHHADR